MSVDFCVIIFVKSLILRIHVYSVQWNSSGDENSSNANLVRVEFSVSNLFAVHFPFQNDWEIRRKRNQDGFN